MTSHTSRHGEGQQKVGPCGAANSTRGSEIYTYAPGETITIEVEEYIPHPGWFRIAFDDDGTDDLAPPSSLDPPEYYVNDNVLKDDLDHQDVAEGGTHTWEVTLPDVECDNCTLQVIQVMLDKLPYDPNDSGAFSNDLYFACIDIVLEAPEDGDDDPMNGGRDAGVGMDQDPSTGGDETDGGMQGMQGSAGSGGVQGSAGSGGMAGSGGAGAPMTGGSGGGLGTAGSGGFTGVGGGAGGSGGTAPGTAGAGPTGGAATSDGSGCSVAAMGAAGGGWLGVWLLLPLWLRRRR